MFPISQPSVWKTVMYTVCTPVVRVMLVCTVVQLCQAFGGPDDRGGGGCGCVRVDADLDQGVHAGGVGREPDQELGRAGAAEVNSRTATGSTGTRNRRRPPAPSSRSTVP